MRLVEPGADEWRMNIIITFVTDILLLSGMFIGVCALKMRCDVFCIVRYVLPVARMTKCRRIHIYPIGHHIWTILAISAEVPPIKYRPRFRKAF